MRSPLSGPTAWETLPYAREFPSLFRSKRWKQTIAANCYVCESMREIDTLRNVDMAQRKSDDQITKKFIQSVTE